jgi:hypothetical protein
LGFHVDQSQARFEVSNGLSTYENPVLGVKLRAPGAWEQGEGAPNVFIPMKSSDHSMELIFGALARVPFFTVDRASKEIQKVMGWNGLSVFEQLRWTTEGDPWISTEFCQLLPTPRAVPRGGGHLGSLRGQCSQQDPDMAKEKEVLHADPGHSSDARSRHSKQSIDDVSIAPPRCFGGLSEIPPCAFTFS